MTSVRMSPMLLAVPILASAAMLSPACALAPAAVPRAVVGGAPSKLDYVVLASLADSTALMSMSAYSAPQTAPTSDDR